MRRGNTLADPQKTCIPNEVSHAWGKSWPEEWVSLTPSDENWDFQSCFVECVGFFVTLAVGIRQGQPVLWDHTWLSFL